MKKNLLLVLSAFSVAALVACGDDVTNVTEVKGSSMSVLQKGEKLSKQSCDTTNIGDMFYVMDSSAAYICDGDGWVSMKGADGKDGVGEDGASCTAKEIKGGYKIVCGGDSVGVVKNGEKGKDGVGEDGASCTTEKIENGYKIVCGGDSVGVLKNGENGLPGASTSCSAYPNEDNTGFVLTCGGAEIGTIKNGKDGKSAYDVAVENGFKGSEDEWLESLKAEAVIGQFVDERDGQLYRTVKIGDQVWMAQNLNYGDSAQTPALTDATWCGGGESGTENEGVCAVYGRLYTWAAAKEACPSGWQLPDTTELKKLFGVVDENSKVGTVLKSVSGWNDYDEGESGNGLDFYGFSAVPAGYKDNLGSFLSAGFSAYFWSSSEYTDSRYAHYVKLSFKNENEEMNYAYKGNAFSVRCIKD